LISHARRNFKLGANDVRFSYLVSIDPGNTLFLVTITATLK